MRRHLIPAFGPLPLADLSPTRVRAWFAGYGTRTPTARAHAYQVLGSIMAQAEDDGLIPRNPCRIKSGGRSAPRREPEVLTLQELFRLSEAMPEKHRALTPLCGLCGLCRLRFGEAAALRRRDVDLDKGVVRVTAPQCARTGARQPALPSPAPAFAR